MIDLNLKFDYPEFILPAIDDPAHYVVVPAGRQIGKTYNFVQWILEDTMELDCPSLWVDTVQTNIDKYVERYFRPLLKPVLLYCDWNAQKKILKLPRGYIDFGSAQKPENLEGFNYKRAVLNEAGHILKKPSLWHNTIMPMIKAEDNQTRIIGTPKGQGLFEELYIRGMEHSNEYSSYRFTVYDSPYWSKGQIEEVRGKTPELIWKQEYMASFEAFAGMIYPDFKEELHVREPQLKRLTDTYFIALDVGWEHPTACLLGMEDIEHNIFIRDEFREQYLDTKQIGNYINSMLMRNGLTMENVQLYVIDPASKGTQQTSGQSILFQLQEEGWPFIPADNNVMAGISRTTRLLRENKLYISRRCPKLIDEVKNYHWKEYGDGGYGMNPTPYKIGDDLADAFRYMIMGRPDYFDHPELDMYGRVVEEKEDSEDINEIDMGERVDDLMSGDSIF